MGTLIHDYWAPYWSLSCDHALCGAHLLRELICQKETTTPAWLKKMSDTLLEAEQACKVARQAHAVLTGAQIETFVTQYCSLVQIGQAQHMPVPKTAGKRGRAKQSSTYNLLQRLFEREREVLRFMHDLTAPFTNNLAEHAVRMTQGQATNFGLHSHLDRR
jgi:transposase